MSEDANLLAWTLNVVNTKIRNASAEAEIAVRVPREHLAKISLGEQLAPADSASCEYWGLTPRGVATNLRTPMVDGNGVVEEGRPRCFRPRSACLPLRTLGGGASPGISSHVF
jgi:hypothetical protein